MEMVNDWEIQIDWFLTWFDRHIGSFQNGMCLWDIVDKKVIEGMIREHLKHEINLIVSSTEKRVAKEIVELLKDKRLEHSESNRDGIELSINYIKSKYE